MPKVTLELPISDYLSRMLAKMIRPTVSVVPQSISLQKLSKVLDMLEVPIGGVLALSFTKCCAVDLHITTEIDNKCFEISSKSLFQ